MFANIGWGEMLVLVVVCGFGFIGRAVQRALR
jgi:voltage-gated potassium channel Kch